MKMLLTILWMVILSGCGIPAVNQTVNQSVQQSVSPISQNIQLGAAGTCSGEPDSFCDGDLIDSSCSSFADVRCLGFSECFCIDPPDCSFSCDGGDLILCADRTTQEQCEEQIDNGCSWSTVVCVDYNNTDEATCEAFAGCTWTPSCTPDTCEAHSYTCGTLDDGCGGTDECGSCVNGYTCTNAAGGTCLKRQKHLVD